MKVHQAIAWFDAQDWVCTPAELVWIGYAFGGSITSRDGFIHQPGREELAWMRRQKGIWTWRKLKKARRWVRVLACIPTIRMIAIGNGLGYGNSNESGDVDLVIVTTPGQLWLTRLLVVALLRLFRQRPGEHARDALCPSFFLTINALNLESLQIPPLSLDMGLRSFPQDPYLLWWMTQLTVLYDRDGTYDRFWNTNHGWIEQWLPGARPRAKHPRLMVRDTLHVGSRRFGQRFLQRVGDGVERWARQFQEQRLSQELRDAAALPSTDVVISDDMLKFHLVDRRQHFRDAWLERLSTQCSV